MKDYYKILEVHPSASQDVIAKAYKVLAKKYHPDMQHNVEDIKTAEEKFKEISEAYDVLSHVDQREEYDKVFRQEQSANSVDINQFEELRQYCQELESQLNTSNNNNYYSKTQQYSNNDYNTSEQNVQNQAYKDALYKAYSDAYYNTLRKMGYKIRYKKSFKETMKNFLALVITFTIVAIIGYVLYQIPSFREYIHSLLIF